MALVTMGRTVNGENADTENTTWKLRAINDGALA